MHIRRGWAINSGSIRSITGEASSVRCSLKLKMLGVLTRSLPKASNIARTGKENGARDEGVAIDTTADKH